MSVGDTGAPGRPHRSVVSFGGSKTMNIIRIRVIGFWLLFAAFWLLMCFSWQYRFLWVALFCAATVLLELIRPRRSPMPRAPMPTFLKVNLWLVFIAFVLTVVFHGFLYPYSAGLYLLAKVVLVATSAPVLCYKVWLDHRALRAARNASAEPGAAPNAGSAGAPPASVS